MPLFACSAVLNQCNYVVLDEADRMIDLGFEPQVGLQLPLVAWLQCWGQSHEPVVQHLMEHQLMLCLPQNTACYCR